jgi:flagellar biosynthesis protein FliQ
MGRLSHVKFTLNTNVVQCHCRLLMASTNMNKIFYIFVFRIITATLNLTLIKCWIILTSLTLYPLIFNKIQGHVQHIFKSSHENNENLYPNYYNWCHVYAYVFSWYRKPDVLKIYISPAV